MERFGGRKGKEKWYNCITISKQKIMKKQNPEDGILFKSNEPVLTQHYYTNYTVCIRVHSDGFSHMFDDMSLPL